MPSSSSSSSSSGFLLSCHNSIDSGTRNNFLCASHDVLLNDSKLVRISRKLSKIPRGFLFTSGEKTAQYWTAQLFTSVPDAQSRTVKEVGVFMFRQVQNSWF